MGKLYFASILLLLVFTKGQAQNAADRDPFFNVFEQASDNYVYDGEFQYRIRSQADGKLLVLTKNQKKIIRLDGDKIDRSFNLEAFFDDVVYDFAVQPDGKIIAVGYFTAFGQTNDNRIIRLNPDGTKDLGFSSLGFNAAAKSMALQPDGKIVVSGDFTSYNGIACGKLVRLNADASLDTTFNAGTGGLASVILAQPDGKTVVVGDFTTFNGITARGIIRLNANGTKDSTFAITGGFNTQVLVNCGVLQPDGKMLFGGTFTTFNNAAAKRLVRVNANGSIDTTFATANGFPEGGPYDIVVQPDHKILVVGNQLLTFNGVAGSKNIWRFNADGTLDNSLNAGTGFNNLVRAAALKPDGKIALAGWFNLFNDTSVASVVEINADGSRNPGFNVISKAFNLDAAKTIIQSDGKIVVQGGFNSYNGIPSRNFIRLNPDGSHDNTFHSSANSAPFVGTNQFVNDFKVLPDDKMILAGSFTNFNGTTVDKICKLNSDGTIDTSFFTAIGFQNESIQSVFVQNDGKILVGGAFKNVSAALHQGVLRLNADGTLDSSFQACSYSNNTALGNVNAVAALSDGKILVSGLFNKFNNVTTRGIVRLNANGTLDPGFVADASLPLYSYKFALQADGKIILHSLSPRSITRLNADGSIDQNFTIRSGASELRLLAIQPDGKILIESGINEIIYHLERLNPDGSTDETFDWQRGFNDYIYNISFQADGQMVVVGAFTTYNGLPENHIVRLLGGDMNFLKGENKVDLNTNGCDNADAVFPNLKLRSADGTTYTCDTTGNYNFGFGDGNYTFAPIVENPSYFSVAPTNVTINFPMQESPVPQNFCITPTGNHNDLEIVIIPINAARPGFNTTYKVIVKNKGNLPLSGTFSLAYNDAVMDYVSSSLTVSAMPGNLQWDFTNLNPFQSVTATVVFNMNSPLENPALNSGDILNFNAAIAIAQTDETPADNVFALNQGVVNSLDPNDKTCLEGNTIAAAKIGDYVHYIIRFENTGTWPAQNIKVADIIDANKFEISTLMPVTGSHLYTTETSGNKVEFSFQNINLPFLDATNDGYLVFKIRTKSSLVQGDTFSNSASIYFDYNYPIVTNTATTTIAALATTDFAFEKYFSIYPNPATDFLMIENKQKLTLDSIEIYSLTGQRVLVFPNAQGLEKLDISNLKTGSYFLKIHSEKGTSNVKFLKK